MKKIFLLFLSYLYLMSAFGVAIQTHFCKKETVQETSFFTKPISREEPCAICVSKNKEQTRKKEGCCQHETKVLRLTDEQQKVVKTDLSFKFWNEAILHRFFGAVFESPSVHLTSAFEHYPQPLLSVHATPLYIYHCVYRI
ncbi:HYC_CC_PP family protein [Sphingobacterium spiritivorum]|uniref:HYC_CC_PP family protein n=1 Tax=Sphingobacterium spiritivorum TaxID=258 RepID=UPI003DA3EDD8